MDTIKDGETQGVSTSKVYYFSGTGNSYYVAKRISDALNAKLLPLVLLKKDDAIEADLLFFVFPVYDFKPPKLASEIIGNLTLIRARRIIAIATYGIALSSALRHFERTLSKAEVTLSQGYGIRFPHNAVGSIGFTETENNARLLAAEHRINHILRNIESLSAGSVEKITVFENLTLVKQLPHVLKLIWVLLFKGPESLAFKVTENCVQCHLCQSICPVDNIEWGRDKPIFGDRCTSCFACIQWCPNSAIRLGDFSFEEMGMKHYHHPKVKAANLIINQKYRK
ncbi:EFR1 family ferrodoxin [Acetobacterium sp.]|uniref:EFR1 family ferrodoxin n=1 Tax=Acetobacterium sp. TaxID=1872094 RepID=UPI0035936DA8